MSSFSDQLYSEELVCDNLSAAKLGVGSKKYEPKGTATAITAAAGTPAAGRELPAAGTAPTSITVTQTSPFGFDTAAHWNAWRDSVIAMNTKLDAVEGVLRSVVNDLQANGVIGGTA